ncbi:MAG: hypothetical protein Q8P23_04560 [bacterium]|nr:hypothetical protein [bacterium]
MKKYILVALLIIGGIPIALFAIGMGIGVWQVATDQSVDCSNDSKCLAKYLNSCTGTKVIAARSNMICFPPDNINPTICQDAKFIEAIAARSGVAMMRTDGVTGITRDFVLSARKMKSNGGEEVCRVYMGGFTHKDSAVTSQMSATEIANIDKVLGSESIVASNKRTDSCDYTKENWAYISDEMSTLASGSLLDHPKAENCTALVQDLSKMTPEEYQSAKEGYQRLLKTGSSAN